MKYKFNKFEKQIVLEALFYYKDYATQINEEFCGLKGRKRIIITNAINKIQNN